MRRFCAAYGITIHNRRKTGNLWLERRKFAGTLIRQASILEGFPPAEQDEIDNLINSYIGWLISNLNSEDATQSFDNVAH